MSSFKGGARMTHLGDERNSTSNSSSVLMRNCDLPPSGRNPRRVFVSCSGQRRFDLLVPAAARYSFPRWEAFSGEVPMQAFVSFGDYRLVGVS
jgi:hypothetical protein